jgi:hypothetical protein
MSCLLPGAPGGPLPRAKGEAGGDVERRWAARGEDEKDYGR